MNVGEKEVFNAEDAEECKIKNAKWQTKCKSPLFHFAFLILHFAFSRVLCV